MTNDNPLKRILAVRGMGQVLTAAAGLLIMCVVFSYVNPSFASGRNLANLLRQIVPILLVGIAQSYVLITGNIDLSIGSVLGMSCMISATLMSGGMHPLAAVALTMAAALAIGWLNGALVSRCRLPPFIATLGTMIIARGIAQLVNGNRNTDSIRKMVPADVVYSAQDAFRDIFYLGKTFGIHNCVWLTLLIFTFFAFLLSKTRTGRHIYAVGSNIEAARLSGVDTARTVTVAYVVSAFCAGTAGLYTTALSGMGAMDAGNMYELYAVAAAVIGGVSTLGGQGILLGTVFGASIWCVLKNGLQFAGVSVAYQNIVIGVIVIVSVLLDVIVRTDMLKGKFKKKTTS
ncbi:MAG: ABC transporter permease [Methylobacteriaceae bacterium]|nr:ABC transporter permease [Methylobacteriaceae bacterium]